MHEGRNALLRWCVQVGQAGQQIGQRKLVQMRQEGFKGPIQNTGQAAIAGQQTAVGIGQKALRQGQAGLHAAHHCTNANVFWGMGQANPPAFAAHGGQPALQCQLVGDLHQVGLRDLLGLRHFGNRAQTVGVLRHVHEQAQSKIS